MKQEIIKRLRSKVVWLGIIAQILNIVVLLRPDVADTVKIVLMSVVEILTLFGLLNNPSDRENF